jgi:hypothetical protein
MMLEEKNLIIKSNNNNKCVNENKNITFLQIGTIGVL